jgi:hypothetical protein
MKRISILLAVFAVLGIFVGSMVIATPKQGENAPVAKQQQQPDSRPAAQPKPQLLTSDVSRMVFIGLEKACGCVLNRINDCWSNLQAATQKKYAVSIERVNMDTHRAEAMAYRAKKPFTALPAIYLFDKSGKLLDLLQGELSVDEFTNALNLKRDKK